MNRNLWKNWIKSLKRNTYALYLAKRDPRVPLLAKILIGIVLAYVLSPIDIIPDFIPIIGYLDDILLLPLGIWLAIRFIPSDVWKECQVQAVERQAEMARSYRAAMAIIIIWLLTITGIMVWVFRLADNMNSGA